VQTHFGTIMVRKGVLQGVLEVVFVQRHKSGPSEEYDPPHLVNYKGIMECFMMLRVQAVVAICSVGSLKPHINMGSIVIPDDYFCPSRIISSFTDHQGHTVPEINEEMRKQLLTALFENGFRPLDGGVYVNAHGPRFETKSEIRFMAAYGDIIGMTGAHEATVAKELGLPYGMVTIVDNMANGLGQGKLTLEEFFSEQEKNKPRAEMSVQYILEHFAQYPEILRDISKADGNEQATNVDECDTVIHAGHIVTVNDKNEVLEGQAIVLHGGKIINILDSSQADKKYGHSSTKTMQVVRLPHSVLMPGLINAHTHSPMVYMRGFADDMDLVPWLTQKVWPVEVRCVSAGFVRNSTQLACAEFIKGGTTCFNDMYFFPENTADVVDEVGIRANIGCILLEFPSNYAQNADQYFEKAEKNIEALAKRSSRVKLTISPHSTYAVSEEHLVAGHTLAKKHGMRFHTHVHETEAEVNDSVNGNRESQFCHNCSKNCRPLKNLVDIGIVDENLVAAHMANITDGEITTFAEKGAHVVHCPTSNLKLASGFCPVAKLLDAGVNVAIGTDGASSNNSLDMFQEIKLAAILAKGLAKDSKSVPAQTAIRMGTINGAKALGIDDKVGSLEVGKQADLIAVDMSGINSAPLFDVVSNLVYATNRTQVSDVWVDGKRLLKSNKLTTLDEGAIRRDATAWREKIIQIDSNHDGSYN